jgi:hypothetical protein
MFTTFLLHKLVLRRADGLLKACSGTVLGWEESFTLRPDGRFFERFLLYRYIFWKGQCFLQSAQGLWMISWEGRGGHRTIAIPRPVHKSSRET